MRNFFKGLSVTQLSAGALAAVASFLLSAKIGIAGSVIGVAVGSIVSAVVSQLYQNVVNASSEKLQNAVSQRSRGNDEDPHEPSSPDDDATMTMTTVMAPTPTADDDAPTRGRTVIGTAMNAGRHAGAETTPMRASTAKGGNTVRSRRIAFVVAIVSALLAVAATAGVILMVTQGHGTDSVVRDWVGQTHVERPEAPKDDTTTHDGDGENTSGETVAPEDGMSSNTTGDGSGTTHGGTSSGQTGGGQDDTTGTGATTGGGTGTTGTDGSGSSNVPDTGEDASGTGDAGGTANDGSTTSDGSGTSDAGTDGAGAADSGATR